MIIEVKAPSPGESVSEIEIATWYVQDGDIVSRDQEIAEIESEKATLALIAEEAGQIKILKQAGEVLHVGTVICTIDTSKAIILPESSSKKDESIKSVIKEDEVRTKVIQETDKKELIESAEHIDSVKATPLAKKIMEDHGLTLKDIEPGLKKITSHDVKKLTQNLKPNIELTQQEQIASRHENRSRMSALRRKLSERLVAVKNETAMLTTFNEADMSRIISIRKKYQEEFVKKHGVKLGFMSFFTRASVLALNLYPQLNSRIEGEDIVTPMFCDIGIAVQTDKGLMVPIIRNAERLDLAGIEKEIIILAEKARTNRLSIEEMKGGTFTITNGGIYGSLMSTPLLNPPQAAILGMHVILERPVAIDGKIEIRPMMYLALSYDHRIIDGRDSVSFLLKIKELIENPEKLLFNGIDPLKTLLGI